MPDMDTSRSSSNIVPITPEPVPFTEYGDASPRKHRVVATRGWRLWLQILLALVAISALSFAGLVVWQGEVVIGGMAFANPFSGPAEHQLAQNSPEPTPTPHPDPVVAEHLLQPLKLNTISPRIAISQGKSVYVVNYEGGDLTEFTKSRYTARMGGSNRCMFYKKNEHEIYRSAIDGSQEQFVVGIDPKLLEVPEGWSGGHVGPGYGIEIIGVDEDCQQAIVRIVINAATDSMPEHGVYLVAPEIKSDLVLLDSGMEFLEFRGGKPWFESYGRIYTVNTNGIFNSPYNFSTPMGYNPDSFTNISPDGVLIDAVYLSPDSSENIDPVSGHKVASKASKIIEVSMRNGGVSVIAPDSPTYYQLVRVSPDFNYVAYLHDTGDVVRDYYLSELYLYDRQNRKTHKLKVAPGSIQEPVWLDNTTFVVGHSIVKPDSGVANSMVMKCSVVNPDCQKLVDGRLVAELYQ